MNGSDLALYAFLGLWLGAGAWCYILCGLKGKWGMLVLGFLLFGPVAIFGAWRLAKPKSWWARHRYDEAKMARAMLRFPENDRRPQHPMPASSALFLDPE